MTAAERRDKLLVLLKDAKGPISASILAKNLSVSRQIIVNDIALLRASGSDILATARGYIFSPSAQDKGRLYTIACSHNAQQTQAELYAIVDSGCTVKDVIVEHPIYGQMTGVLEISNRFDVDQFIKKLHMPDVVPLSALTDGVHLHTIACPDDAHFELVKRSLTELGILFSD